MGNTPNLTLPYPELTDPADVPADIKRLADRLDLLLPEAVGALPGSPVDGQEVYYLASAANGVVWHLRYRAASTSSYKWELVGGSDLRSPTAGSATGSTAAFVPLDQGPTLVIPLAGEYEIDWTIQMQSQGAGANTMQCDLGVNGTRSGGGTHAMFYGIQGVGSRLDGTEKRAIPAAATLNMMISNSGAGVTTFWGSAVIMARPVRVS